jgi:DNA-binding transcriptional LysR family regulator
LSAKVGGMELDLGQVRAFVVTAEQLHFGHAAGRLFLTQQALSKRIRQLERTLGEPLFVRGTRGVELTSAGHRFLPHAHQLLEAADAAVQAAQPASWPLRVDVWGHVQAPVRMVRQLIDQAPELRIQLSMRRSLPAALEALEHREIDACLGRVQDLGQPWPTGLTHRPVLLERLAVAVDAQDPLADASLLRPTDLHEWILWVPAAGSAPEVLGAYQRFADHFAIPMDSSGHNLGLEGIIGQLRTRPGRFTLLGIDWPIPAQAGIALIPITPAPCCLWSLVWRQGDQHPLLEVLLDRALQTGQAEGWLAYDPQHDWLPDVDLAELRRHA